MKNTVNAALETLSRIHTFQGHLGSFAYSIDIADRWVAETYREAAKDLARAVADGDIAEDFAYVAVTWACAGDEYALQEIAGRFQSAVKRLCLVNAIRRHPKARCFTTLVTAIERGRVTQAQMNLATKLAKEAA